MFKNTHIWLPAYIRQQLARLRRREHPARPAHVMFCLADHFEPDWNRAGPEQQLERVKAWTERYPSMADRFFDGDGRHPRHTFFYPAETYNAGHLERLADLCRRGYGEVEIHLHHDGDNARSFRQKIRLAKKNFSRHGLLGADKTTGEIRFGFIHGNWSLNNSRRDGRWCGVNNETSILKDEGCYADFTMPSAPSETQTRTINSLYYDVHNNENAPKSHNDGVECAEGMSAVDSALLLVQGPLALNWNKRKFGLFPRIENGEISAFNPPDANRVDLWARCMIRVAGRDDWIFIKVHTHGATEENRGVLLKGPIEEMHRYLCAGYDDGIRFRLHYVTAREMVNIIKAAEAGQNGDPGGFRDYKIHSRIESR